MIEVQPVAFESWRLQFKNYEDVLCVAQHLNHAPDYTLIYYIYTYIPITYKIHQCIMSLRSLSILYLVMNTDMHSLHSCWNMDSILENDAAANNVQMFLKNPAHSRAKAFLMIPDILSKREKKPWQPANKNYSRKYQSLWIPRPSFPLSLKLKGVRAKQHWTTEQKIFCFHLSFFHSCQQTSSW